MVQQFFTEAAQGIYSISGFIDASGKRLAVRAANKVLQRPRKLGIGLCFSQRVFDEDRVVSLAQLVHVVACGDTERVERLAKAAQEWKAGAATSNATASCWR